MPTCCPQPLLHPRALAINSPGTVITLCHRLRCFVLSSAQIGAGFATVQATTEQRHVKPPADPSRADDAVRYERELAEYERRNPGYCAWAAARRKGRKAWAASWPGAPAPAPTARQLFVRSRRETQLWPDYDPNPAHHPHDQQPGSARLNAAAHGA